MTISFFKKYPSIHDLLGGYFCEMDLDDKSFEDIITEYKGIYSKEELVQLKKEFNIIFQEQDGDYKFVREHSNVYLENNEEMYEWFHELYGYLFEDE